LSHRATYRNSSRQQRTAKMAFHARRNALL
jgi:hypothetical protein